MNHCQLDKGFADLRQDFIVLAQATTLAQPGESALHDPMTGQQGEAHVGQSRDKFVRDAQMLLTPERQRTRVAALIEQQTAQTRRRRQTQQDQPCSRSVLQVSTIDDHLQEQARTIDRKVAFASLHMLAPVAAMFAPSSIVGTLWLSAITVFGSGSRPVWRHTCWSSCSLMCSQLPLRLSAENGYTWWSMAEIHAATSPRNLACAARTIWH
jgi:hypothetical protein